MFVSLSMIILYIYLFIVLSIQFALVWSTRYSPVFLSVCQPCLVLSCPALMSTLKTVNLSFILVSVFLVPPCCVHRDRRPDQNSKRRPFSTFCFVPVCLFVKFTGCRSLKSRRRPRLPPVRRLRLSQARLQLMWQARH